MNATFRGRVPPSLFQAQDSLHANVEARLAARLATSLAELSETVPHDIAERLRVAREQALAVAREARRSAAVGQGAPVVLGVSRSGAAVLGSGAPWWQRAASLLPLVALLIGLVLIEHQAQREQVHAAAVIDSQLLADDLPPAAYSDLGFAEFLRSGPSVLTHSASHSAPIQ
jgi:Protein of unknown function (DUF3619)